MARFGARCISSAAPQRIRNRAERAGFVAELLQANSAMLNLAKRLGKIEIKTENGTYHVTSLFA
jgi:hypothetical protein